MRKLKRWLWRRRKGVPPAAGSPPPAQGLSPPVENAKEQMAEAAEAAATGKGKPTTTLRATTKRRTRRARE